MTKDADKIARRREQRRQYYYRNREARLAAVRAYKAANPEKAAEAVQRCWDRKRDEYRAREAEWRKRPDVVETLKARRVEYWQRPEVKARRNRQRAEDPGKVISSRIRTRMNVLLRSGGEWNRSKTKLDYTVAELMAHLERQFVKGMGWHNIGEWHIDHIIPLSAFNITGPECPEVKRAWALTNLRPLWKTQNLRKYSKVLTLL